MRIYESADEYFELDGNAILYRCKNGKIREYGAIPSLTVWNMRSVKPLPETCSVEEKFSEQIYEQEYISEVLRKWLMIFQEYGTNGCVINLETGEKYLFERENYCAETSCFSAAFFEYEGHICLLHATKWNRIDITDLETNTLLTARNENDVDYFHGRVAFSPDYKYFVDMGWIWHPVGSPVLYSVGEFLHEYENAYIELDFSGGQQIYCEDWDQRAVWLDNNTFEFNLELPEFFFDEEQEEKIVKEMGGHSGMSHFSVMDIQKKEDGRNLLKRRC